MKAIVPKNGETKIKDDKLHIFQDGEWNETEVHTTGGNIDTGLTMYEVNKQMVARLPDMTVDEIKAKKALILDYDETQHANYYMLLCNELKYYTIFSMNHSDPNCFPLWVEVLECIEYFADSIKAIEFNSDKSAIEFWIKQNNEIYMMVLFNYNIGVINCGR